MAQRCPECHTVCFDGLGRCAGCGCQLSGEKFRRRWEDGIIPYAAIAVVIGVIAAIAWYFYKRGG